MFLFIFSYLLPVKFPNLNSIVNGVRCMYFNAGTTLVSIVHTGVHLYPALCWFLFDMLYHTHPYILRC